MATYPTACPPPTRIRIDVNVDADDDEEDTGRNLSSLMSTYLCQPATISYPKRMCQLIAGELAQRFRSGDVFGRRSTSAFYDVGSAHRRFDRRFYSQPAPVSIDSSEVEFTTLIEVPRQPSPPRLSESPNDFSSTTDDDEEEDSPSTDDPLQLERTSSLKSVSSCVGAEYEGPEQQPLQMEMQTLAEITELTASFTTVSDDTSVDDVTIIFRPPAPVIDLTVDDEDDVRSHFSEGSKSVGSCSVSSLDDEENQLSDSNTYSCLDCLDDVATEDVMPEELSTSFVGKDPKFKMELSVIHEEHGEVSAESADSVISPRDEKPEVDAIISAGLSLTAFDEKFEILLATDFVVKHEPADLCAENMTRASCSEETGAWPSPEASLSFTQSLETVYEAVTGDDYLLPLTDDSVDESVTDSALGATDLTFVAELADAEGSSYRVSVAVKKFLLCFAHVLNLVSAVENQYAPLDTSRDSKPTSANTNTDPSTDTHSSAALVQQNSNSEGHTISETSMISCIADNDESPAVHLVPTIEKCSKLPHPTSDIQSEDVEMSTCCSEMEDENDDNDLAFDNLAMESLSADYDDEISISVPGDTSDQSWSEEEKSPHSDHLLADTSDLCQSEDDQLSYVHLSEDGSHCSGSEDDGLAENSPSSSVYEEKLECCVDADKVASYYTICPKVIDCEQDDLPGEKVVFGQSTLASETPYLETCDFRSDLLNVAELQSSIYEDSSVIAEEESVNSNPNHPSINTVSNFSYVEEIESSFPSCHSSCEESDPAPDSSDYFDTVEDANSLQVATGSVSEPIIEPLARESGDCSDTEEKNVMPVHEPTSHPQNDDSDHSAATNDSELASIESDDPDEDLDQLLQESDDSFDKNASTSIAVAVVEEENANCPTPSDSGVASIANQELGEEQLTQETYSCGGNFDEGMSAIAGIGYNIDINDTSPRLSDLSATTENSDSVQSQLHEENVACFSTTEKSISPAPLVAPDFINEVFQLCQTDGEPSILFTQVLQTESMDQVFVEESIDASDIDVHSTPGIRNLEPVYVEGSPENELRALENLNVVAQQLQDNADAICLSSQYLNFTDILNSKCSSMESTAEENKRIDGDKASGSNQESASDNYSDGEDSNGSDALLHDLQTSDVAADNDLANVSLRFRDADSIDSSYADDPVVGDLVADPIEVMADCLNWLFSIDERTAENVECVEYDIDHELDESQIDSKIANVSQNASGDEAHGPTSDVECLSDEPVIAAEVNEVEALAPESCEVFGRMVCDAANCSFTSSDSKIEYDVNSNQITTDTSQYVTAPQQQTSKADTSAPTSAKPKQHRRSSSSSSSTPDTIHIEGRCSRQGGGHNSTTWCQSGDSIGELSLKLRLKVEWDGRPTAERSSSSSSGDGRTKRSSFDDDSLNSSGSAGAAANNGAKEAPNGRMLRSKLLVDFKHNYPKFIQYSYFSPKVRSRRSPHRCPQTAPTTRVRRFSAADKTPTGSPQKNACHSADAPSVRSTNCATSLSADSARIRAVVHPEESLDQYLRFDDVSPGDWPSFVPTEAASKSSLLLDPHLEALSFKTSTPKGQQPDDSATGSCAQPPAMDSSLTEFEMWESLLESNPEGVTR